MKKDLIKLKQEEPWLRDIDSCILKTTLDDLEKGYNIFFQKRNSYPKFKSKHNNHQSYTTNYTNNNIEVDFDNNEIKLPKLKYVKAKLQRKFNSKIKNVTISRLPSGKYFQY